MTPNLLQYIRHLSEQDRKTLSQKVLKLGEEFGELAKVALPFENAYATTHRFTERESILEEAVDSILCALSVAYDLDFTDDEVLEMMERKAEKWALLQSKECNVKYPLPYEIHVTVMLEGDQTVELFRTACAEVDVKAIVLDLQGQNGETTMIDVMTSSKYFGNNTMAYSEAIRIRRGLEAFGFSVVRVKIETVPWHPAAPVGNQGMPPNCYFESHVPVTIAPDLEDDFRTYVKQYRNPYVHVSRNVYKVIPGSKILMVTMRVNFGNYNDFKAHLDAFVEYLSNTWTLGKVITEFSIYDTKVSHDATWIEG